MEQHIYVLATFMMKDGEPKEMSPRFWYSTMECMLDYLNHAGKPVPGREHASYDEPFEYRWNYAVVEKVSEGPMSINEVIGWWKATYEGDALTVEKLAEAPFDVSGMINFTGIG
jgi:hypothetical protein